MEWRGKPFVKNGKKYIRAHYKEVWVRRETGTQVYDFETNNFWFIEDI